MKKVNFKMTRISTVALLIGGGLVLSACASLPEWVPGQAQAKTDQTQVKADQDMNMKPMGDMKDMGDQGDSMKMNASAMGDMKMDDASMDMSMMDFTGLSDDEIRVKCETMHDNMMAKMKARMESGEMMDGDHKKMDGGHDMKGDHHQGGDHSMMSPEKKAKHEKMMAVHNKCMEVSPKMKAMHEKMQECKANGGDMHSCKMEMMGGDMMGGSMPSSGDASDHEHKH